MGDLRNTHWQDREVMISAENMAKALVRLLSTSVSTNNSYAPLIAARQLQTALEKQVDTASDTIDFLDEAQKREEYEALAALTKRIDANHKRVGDLSHADIALLSPELREAVEWHFQMIEDGIAHPATSFNDLSAFELRREMDAQVQA